MKHIKTLLCFLLVAAITLSLCSCGLFASRVAHQEVVEHLEQNIATLQNIPSIPTIPSFPTVSYNPIIPATKTISIPLCEESYAIGVNKNNPALLNQVNAFIAQAQQNGTLNAIFNRYVGNGTPETVFSASENPNKDQLIVATSTGYEPFEMVSQGRYYGIDIEIAAALANYLGKELVIKDMAFEAVVSAVQSGLCDVAIAALTPTAERSSRINFSNAYYHADQMLVVPATCTIFDGCRTAADIIALLSNSRNTIGCHSLLGNDFINGDTDYAPDGLMVVGRQYATATQALDALLIGEVDYVLADRSAIYAVQQS